MSSFGKASRGMLFRDMVVVYCKNRTDHASMREPLKDADTLRQQVAVQGYINW